jgi:uncharacterized glyoxalase superfamily protein PhnB
MLRNPRYVIAVHDLERSARYYRDVLGFEVREVGAYVLTDDIDELYAAVTANGAASIKDIRDEPWNMREFGIRTVDGHRIMFGCPVRA